MKHYVEGLREKGMWKPGETPWFLLGHAIFCTSDPHGILLAHNDQRVTIVELVADDASEAYFKWNRGLQKRHEREALLSYRVRFADGVEAIVLESELFESMSWVRTPTFRKRSNQSK